jgi:rhamnosyltransferase
MISIIIPTINAANKLEKLLISLQSQTVVPEELLVVDSSSYDNTVEIAQKYKAEVIIIPKAEFDHGGTRTLAAKKSTGDIIIYMTQDALPVNDYAIEKLIKAFARDSKIKAVFGRQIPKSGASVFAKHLRAFNYPDTSYVRELKDKQEYGIKTAFFSDAFAAYDRKTLQNIGYFKEGLIFGEDTIAAANILKSGNKIAYSSEAVVYHSHNYTIAQEFKRYFDIGVFHKRENWFIQKFGKPRGEGVEYIKSGLKFLKQKGELKLIPAFVFRNIAKYIGYKSGLNHKFIPVFICRKLSMNSGWWN